MRKKENRKNIELGSFGLPPHPQNGSIAKVDVISRAGPIMGSKIINNTISDTNSEASSILLKPMSQLANRSHAQGPFPTSAGFNLSSPKDAQS
jgi:hypothetical protein